MILHNNRQYAVLRENGPQLVLLCTQDGQLLHNWRMGTGPFSHLKREISQATASKLLGITQSRISEVETFKRTLPDSAKELILKDELKDI